MPGHAAHVPPELARRIDGLARAAHRFHRYAHHPLCAAYAGEVFRLGRRTRLCRGCTLVAIGAIAGALAAALLPAPGTVAMLVVTALAAPIGALAAWAPRRAAVG